VRCASTDTFFAGAQSSSSQPPLWRLSLPSDALAIELDGAQLVEWGGAQRWLCSGLLPEVIRARVAALGACHCSNGVREGAVFHPLTAPMLALQRNLKNAFDPAGSSTLAACTKGSRHADASCRFHP
jgi:glycolate oxidase FAD binding subunit